MTAASTTLPTMMTVMAQLTEIMKTETALLKQRDYSQLSAVIAKKEKLTQSWQGFYDRLFQEPELLDSLTPKQREAFIEGARTLQSVTQENERLLRARRDASDRIIKTAVSTTQQNRKAQAGYGRGGAYRHPGAYARSVPMSAVLNQAI